MAGKKGSKNNMANRGAGAEAKMRELNGKKVAVIPVMLVSKKGKFMAAQFKNGPLVMDKQGNVVPYDKV